MSWKSDLSSEALRWATEQYQAMFADWRTRQGCGPGSAELAEMTIRAIAAAREDGVIQGRYEGGINYAANTGKFDQLVTPGNAMTGKQLADKLRGYNEATYRTMLSFSGVDHEVIREAIASGWIIQSTSGSVPEALYTANIYRCP